MKESFYFKHDYTAHSDPKIEKMLYKEKWAGYGLYWAILEKLAQETDKWTLECNYDSLEFTFRTNKDFIKRVIENYGLFEIKDGYFYSKRLYQNMLERQEKRKKAQDAAKARWAKEEDKNANAYANGDANGDANGMPGEERRGEERKEEERKKKEIKLENEFEKFWDLYQKKDGKPRCFKVWKRLSIKNKTKIFEKVENYVKSTPEVKYRKNPLTWLNGEHWNDEIYSSEQTRPKVKITLMQDTNY